MDAARAAVIGVLGAKLASPLEPRQWDEGVLETHESRRQEIEAVNAVLAGYNDSIKQVQERTSGASIEEIEIRLDRLKATKARHSQDIAPLCAEYLQAKAAKAEAEEKRDGASRLLEEYRTGAFQTLQAEVNEHLAGFNSGFSIDGFQPVNRRFGSMCEYGVRVNETLVSAGKNETAADGTADEPTMGSTLSTGDRNTLALALFFSSRAKDKNLKDSVIVVDDSGVQPGRVPLHDHRRKDPRLGKRGRTGDCAVPQQAVSQPSVEGGGPGRLPVFEDRPP